jgi:hypothetical protein
LLAGLTAGRRRLTQAAFTNQLLGLPLAPAAQRAEFWLGFATLATLGIAVQTVGLVFTLGALFLPTAILAPARRAGLGFHLAAAAAAGGGGALAGFALALLAPRLPTVPVVLAGIGAASFSCRVRR